ncbi:MAG: 2-hydroxyacid dehydrogenase [Chloroflexota bacterium]
MRPQVFVTRRIPQPGMDIIEKECEVDVNPHDRPLTEGEVVEGVRGRNGLLCLLTDAIGTTVMDASPALKVISNYAVGFNNIDVGEATRRGIMVTNTPGVLTDTTADLTFGLLIAIARRLAESDRFTREGKFNGWGPMLLLGQDVHHATLGIVGLGRIGQAVAERASGFKMRVLYTDVKRAPQQLEEKLGVTFVSLDELLEQSDFVTLHVPLLDETRHMIDEAQLKKMKPGACLINAARGPLVNEQVLVRALREGWIRGAALDVYENEPNLTPGLADLDNAVLVPHIGSASTATREKMATMAADNLVTGLRGDRPPHLVNPEVLGNRQG